MIAAAPKTHGAQPPIKLIVDRNIGVDKAGGGNAIIKIAAGLRLCEPQADALELRGYLYGHITSAAVRAEALFKTATSERD